MADLPRGTVTFLFTDIEGSSRLWERHGDEMAEVVRLHDELLADSVTRHGGTVVKYLGDGVMAVFAEAGSAVAAAVLAQQRLGARSWSPLSELRVRMGIHTGTAEAVGDDYHGACVNRAARVAEAANGGQVLVSQTAAVVAELPDGVRLRPLGLHRLRDLGDAEELALLVGNGWPIDDRPPRTLKATDHNLPRQRTSFVGRHAEQAALAAAIGPGRLVTVTGLGGTGKTRLALQVAAAAVSDFGCVRLVELGQVVDASGLIEAVATQLGLVGLDRPPTVGGVAALLTGQRLLVVLDNCEHVVDGAASLVDAIIDRCPEVALLATSREPLAVHGERVVAVQPLPVQDAVALFWDRAVAAGGSVSATDASAHDAAEICRRLDGIPLAVELAASRMRHLSLRDVAARLERRLGLLSSTDRSTAERHRTIAAMLDWSYDLLNPPEQALLRRLSVFASAVDLAAIEQVCSGGELDIDVVFDTVASLVDKSLAVVDWGEVTRYRLLGIVRDYATSKLALSGEDIALEAAHGSWVVGEVEALAVEQNVLGESAWLERLRPFVEDLILVCSRGGEPAARAVAATWKRFEIAGRLAEGRAAVDALLAGDMPPRRRSRLLDAGAQLAFAEGDFGAAGMFHQENLELQVTIDDRHGMGSSHNGLGMVALFGGDVADAASSFAAALEVFEELGDERGCAYVHSSLALLANRRGDAEEAGTRFLDSLSRLRKLGERRDAAAVLNNLGNLADDHGDMPRAQRFYDGSLQLHHQIGDRRGCALSLNNLSIVANKRGHIERAIEYAIEAVDEFRALGDRQGLAAALNNLGNLWSEMGDAGAARVHFEESVGEYRALGDSRGTATALENLALSAERGGLLERAWSAWFDALDAGTPPREVLDELLRLARSCGLDEALAALGTDADVDEALAAARSWRLPPPSHHEPQIDRAPDGLSRREREVASLIGDGLTNRGIAEQLFISERTVDSHISHIRAKLGIDSRTLLALWAAERRPMDVTA